MKRRSRELVLALAIMCLLSACRMAGKTAQEQRADDKTNQERTTEIFEGQMTGQVVMDQQAGKLDIKIDAQVHADTKTWKNAGRVTLQVDNTKAEKLLEELVLPKYPDVKKSTDETGMITWEANVEEDKKIGLSWDTEGGIYFYNDALDINIPWLDAPEESGRDGYITSIIAPGMEERGEEMAEKLAVWLAKYKPLEFRPARVLAGGNENKGYYYVHLQPVYKGIPLQTTQVGMDRMIDVWLQVAQEGISNLQGVFLVKEAGEEELVQRTSLDQAIKAFCADAPTVFGEGKLEITDISLSYMQTREGDRFQLTPTWQFSGIRTDEQKEVQYYDVHYRLEDATFADQIWR